MLRKVGIFVLAAGVIAGGYFLGGSNWTASRPGASSKYTCPKVGAAAPGDDVERKCVPFEGQSKGAASALVTIVEF